MASVLCFIKLTLWFSPGFANGLISIWRPGFQGVTEAQTGSHRAWGPRREAGASGRRGRFGCRGAQGSEEEGLGAAVPSTQHRGSRRVPAQATAAGHTRHQDRPRIRQADPGEWKLYLPRRPPNCRTQLDSRGRHLSTLLCPTSDFFP